MRYVGINERFHDASIVFVDDQGTIEFASQSERYTKVKNDPRLHLYLKQLIQKDDLLYWPEDPKLRKQAMFLEKYNRNDVINDYKDYCELRGFGHHHKSHGASAFFTRPWESSEDTVMLNIDGYGEYQSATIYNNKFELLHEVVYPRSIGSMYALITKQLGFKALEEEYIVMGMASFGEPVHLKTFDKFINLYFSDDVVFDQDASDQLYNITKGRASDAYDKREAFLRALARWCDTFNPNPEDIAATIQAWAEREILKLAKIARQYGSKLCYSGGVAQNIKANTLIHSMFDQVWIPSNPTDGGIALGAAAIAYGDATGKDRINWQDAYLGFNAGEEVNAKDVVNHLLKHKMCGVLNGPAEFGPRALGNRSLLADPRFDIKDTVNKIKNRQKFRPFAPAILEEYADDYFEGPMNEYMQFTANAKHDYKSVIHVDGTSRVQLVPKNSRSILRQILEEWYDQTKVPMLLNTSLNVKGKPICNDRYDAYQFEVDTKTKVFYI